MKKHESAFTLLVFFLSVKVLASAPISPQDTCKNPFAGITESFTLQEIFSCSGEMLPLGLSIWNTNDSKFHTPGQGMFYYTSDCNNQTKATNLRYNKLGTGGQEIIQSLEAINSNQGRFEIKSTCKNETIAILDIRPKPLNLDRGTFLVSLSIIAADTGYIIAYVLPSENSDTDVTIRDPENNVLATAKKTFFNDHQPCYAHWKVKNKVKGLDPAVISFILTWKENRELNCPLSTCPPQPTCAGLSNGQFFGAIVGIAAVALLTGGSFLYAQQQKRAVDPFRD